MSDTVLKTLPLIHRIDLALFKRWAWGFTALLVGVFAGVWAFSQAVSTERLNALLAQAHSPLQHYDQQVTQAYFESLGDLGIISQLPFYSQFEPGNNALLRERLAPFLLMFAKNYQHYQQVRFIDTEGMEVVRIERDGTTFRNVPVAQLQNKASRPYVLEGLTLQPQQAYVSMLDLNVENGELERPLRPMLRYAAPVFNAKRQRLGLIVLNYDAKNMLDKFEASIPDAGASRSWLLNERGFYLAGGDPGRRWGFMLDMPHATLADDRPTLWGMMQDQGSGHIETDDGWFVFRRVLPLQSTLNSALQVPNQQSPMYRLWVVHQVNPQALYALTPWASPMGKGLLAVMVVSLGVGLWFWIKSDALRQRARTQQRTLFNASADGVHVLDKDGKLLAFNNTFAQMLGYAPEQLRSLYVHDWDEQAMPAEARHALPQVGDPPLLFETVHRTADGRLLEVEIVATAIELDGQSVLHCASRDIGPRKALQAAMRQTEQRAAQLIEHAPDPIIVINETGIIELTNPAAERLFGHAQADMVGQNVSMLMPEPMRSQHDGFLQAYAQGAPAKAIGHTRELVAMNRWGQPVPIQLRVNVDPQADGSRRFVGFIREL